MDLDLFDYHLPREHIAQEKSVPRDSSRLFLIDTGSDPPAHDHLRFRQLPDLMEKEDLLILNRTRVIPARVFARKGSGGRAEVLFLGYAGNRLWEGLIGGRRIGEGGELISDDGSASIRIARRLGEGKCLLEIITDGSALDRDNGVKWMKKCGVMPTPPYIKRILKDPEEYQTIYGDREGSVVAPTAGLHFTENLMSKLRSKGIRIEFITLHVGLGTFAPIKSVRIEDHRMEEEEFIIPDETAAAVQDAVSNYLETGRRRIWAVGTTVMRTLETGFDRSGKCVKRSGHSNLFITPGYDFKLPYRGFITNFHLPRSTPLMLVSAFHRREGILKAYDEALERGYRFYSLGDSMAVIKGDRE
ncbi:MAG: tRNA preQ1(34) S-adenosylmethionine ribosyltransferase-isomerase QueA [Thermoplasmatota archaeon]